LDPTELGCVVADGAPAFLCDAHAAKTAVRLMSANN